METIGGVQGLGFRVLISRGRTIGALVIRRRCWEFIKGVMREYYYELFQPIY